MRALRWVSGLFLLSVWLALPAFGQDPVVDPDNPVGPGALAWGWSELVKWVIAMAGTYGFYYLNVARGWISGLSNPAKVGLNIGLTTALMLAGELVHATVTPNPADWSAATLEGLAAGALTALAARLGIQTARLGVSKPFRSTV